MFKVRTGTIVIDLKENEKEMFSRLNKKVRYDIKKAIKNNLKCEIVSDEESKSKCYEIYKEMCKQHLLIPNKYLDLFDDDAIVMIAKVNDKIISFSVVGKRKANLFDDYSLITLKYNATQKKYASLQPNSLLYWEIIRFAKAKGYDKLELGGTDLRSRNEQTINRSKFKRKWNGEEIILDKKVSFSEWFYWRFLSDNNQIRKIRYLIYKCFKF